MKKKSINFSNLKPYFINIFIVILIFFVSLYINEIAPFGKYSIATNDSFYQYQPMLYSFLRSIQEGVFSIYSFVNGLGNSFLFNYVYYLSSPINIFALPFKSPTGMFVCVITLKLIITTITMTFYALKKTNNNFLSTIISVSYVFSAWFLAYHQTIMWVDAFMMFSLFQYGLEKLLKDRNPYVYIFSLAYIMVSNFYLAFMICIYTLLYFIFYMLFNKANSKEKLNNFNVITLSTLVTILLSFFYIYITYDSFMNIGLYINSVSQDFTSVPILNFIKSFFSGSVITTLGLYENTFPNIALNTTFTISLLYYFVNKNIPIRERIKNLLVFIFIIILIYSKTLNYVINCFHVPVGYSFRYSFIITFFLIYLFIQNYKSFDSIIPKRIFIVNFILICLLVMELLFKNIEIEMFVFNLVFVLIFSILFIFYNKSKLYKYTYVGVILIEIFISSSFNIKSNLQIYEGSIAYNDSTTYREVVSYTSDDSSDVNTIMNLNIYENKSVIPYFSSMQYNSVFLDLDSLGCYTDDKSTIFICPDNEMFQSMFNIKANNDYYLEKIYAVSGDVKELILNGENYLENHNILLKNLSNNEDILEKYNLEAVNDSRTKFKVTKSGTYYLLLNELVHFVTINNEVYTYDNDLISSDNNINYLNNTLYLKVSIEKNDIIEVSYYDDVIFDDTLTVYYFNEDMFVDSYEKLKKNQIKYISYSDSIIEGTINVDENQIIFTTIPYDKNWKVTIDGKEVENIRVLNSLMGIECEEGEHTIKLEYKPNYVIPLMISVGTFIGLISKIIFDKKKRNEN